MSMIVPALLWYMSIGAVIALMYNLTDRETRPALRVLVILTLILAWLPAIICFAFDQNKTVTPNNHQ